MVPEAGGLLHTGYVCSPGGGAAEPLHVWLCETFFFAKRSDFSEWIGYLDVVDGSFVFS